MNEKTPFIRIAKREDLPKSRIWMIRTIAFAVAILLGALIFLIAGTNPFTAYGTILASSLGKITGIRQVIKIAVPLLGTALALAPCFAMRFWNIGGEGQITMGAVAASFFALNFAKTIPSPILLLLMGIFAMVFGAMWAAIPAAFKARWGTNETLFTLMMNYIAIGIVGWLQGGPWEGKPGSQIIPLFDSAAVLPQVLGVHCGWIIVLLLTAFMFVYMNYTKQGYEIAVLGESENTARYAGMNVTRVTLRTACISGAICGLVGFMVCSGANMTLYSDVADGVGFTAIVVCWLAQFNPFAMIAISLLLAVLDKGASGLQTSLRVPASISDIITGIILLCMLACEFFINYKLILREHSGKEVC
ncbi:branched-chain amino acid ABC transporter permease protein [Firmicutes bacterium CAG:238]|nr:branched-chain amino acid ABC transporter permease protein [Firmicutes bacterium CAG:238]